MPADLADFLVAQFFAVALVFARVGSAMVFMPGFGETFVSPRIRILMALVISIGLTPMAPAGDTYFSSLGVFVGVMGLEISIGFWIGLCGRIFVSALQLAGFQIGLTLGLSNAFSPEISSLQGGSLLSTAFVVAGTALIFITNAHHLIIEAMLYSYTVFPRGTFFAGDFAAQIVRVVGASFYIGLSISVPFLVVGLVFNVGLGLANRMMPSLPVFLVAAPVLIGAGLFILALSTPSMLMGFLGQFSDWLGTFVI